MHKNKLTICIDFDGVLHSYASGWQGIDVIPDPPVDNAIEALTTYTGYFDVCIYSSRSKDPKGIDAMVKWLLDNGLEPHYLSHIRFPTQKPAAFITLDDRAIQFDGNFPSVNAIKFFKPWYKRGVDSKPWEKQPDIELT